MSDNPDWTPADRRDFAWKIVGRFDVYFGATLTRASLVTALNAVVVGAVGLKATEILAGFQNHSCPQALARWALAIACVLAILSAFFSFRAVIPFLSSHDATSLVFFGNVAASTRKEYIDELAKLKPGWAESDVAGQAHDLARGLKLKYLQIKWAGLFAAAAWVFLLGLAILVIGWSEPAVAGNGCR